MKALVLFGFLSAFLTTGCTKSNPVVCDVSKSVSSLVAAQISSQLTCKNLDAVKASLDKQLEAIKVCEKAEAAAQPAPGTVSTQGVVGNAICGPVIEAVVALGASQLPAEWQCSGSGPITDSLKLQLIAACQKAI